MSIIETESLSYTYPGAAEPSVKRVSIGVKKGEFALITGPSGCGKTTICRCFNGLIPHFYQGEVKGRIKVAGLEVASTQIHELAKHVGLVFQNPENQLFALSVEKDVAFGLENLGVPRKEMRERVDWALSLTGISDLKDRAPYELSGGQQQRVAIASVLAMQPEVMVLDEPTSYLDPEGAARIFKVIHQLNEDLQLTIVLVEHRLDLTARYAHRIIVMDKGSVVLDGDPRQVLDSEEARLIGIGIPKPLRLHQILRDRLNPHNAVPLSSHEMAAILHEVLKN